MKTYLAGLALAFATSAALAAPAATPAATPAAKPGQTLEVSVEGLNCTLCSDALRKKMKDAAGARDIEPRLECGRIYVEMAGGTRINESELTFLLMANGFNLKNVKPTDKTLSAIRKTAPDAC